MNWLSRWLAPYMENATMTRDYRVQLRGNRSVLLFTVYLSILVLVAYAVYTNQETSANTSAIRAQSMLHTFYVTVMGLLGGLIILIAPALTATTIVQERVRGSFDLLFSAPVTPRYYLVGKMIAAYRYTWMLLVLSMPITAASVVMGGATWSDVLVAYLLLSLQSLLFTSIALLISCIAQKPISAVVYTYAAMFFWMMYSNAFAAMAMFSMYRGREQFFTVALSPFTVTVAADTYTTILGREVPNWVLALVVVLLVVRLVLLAAGSLISQPGGKETRMLRANILVYFVIFFGLTGYLASGADAFRLGQTLVWSLLPMGIALPFMASYGYDGERLHRPDGRFRFNRILAGTPSGALPFLYALIGVAALSLFAGQGLTGAWPSPFFLLYVLYAFGFWTLFWGVSRFGSLSGNLRSGRTLTFAVFLGVAFLPTPLLAAVASETFDQGPISPWILWVLYPITTGNEEFAAMAGIYGLVLLTCGYVLGSRAETLYAPQIRRDLVEDERLYAKA